MSRAARAASIIAVALLLALAAPPATATSERLLRGAASLELTSQTAVVAPGGIFSLRVRVEGVPEDGSLRVVVHQRVRSRSELARSMAGDGLRSRVVDTVTPLAGLAPQADGSRRLTLSLDPTSGIALGAEGVYPVEVIGQDLTGTALTSLMTHLVVGPAAGDDAPPLGVAVVAELGARPALQPDGTQLLDTDQVEAIGELVTGLLAAPSVPVTLAVRPETLEALGASDRPGDAELVDALRSAATDRSVLGLPYVAVSPDELQRAGLADELDQQLRRGRVVLADALGVQPETDLGLAPPDLGADGLTALALSGQRRLVVSADQVPPVDPALISFSLAQPFLVSPPSAPDDGTSDAPSTGIEALVVDAGILDRLDTQGSPGLVASRVLSELAFLRLEQPSLARSVVLPLPADTPSAVVQLVLDGLGTGRPFAPLSLGEAFDQAEDLVDPGGERVEVPLLPTTSADLAVRDARALTDGRAHLATFAGLVGSDSPQSDPLTRHLLVASSVQIGAADRRAHLAAVEAAIEDVAGTVSTPARFTLTLTAREGTIPLTITNDSGLPLRVSIRLTSRKLEFPDGGTIDRVLTEPITRIDLAVRARATGAFPLEAAVITPDGQRTLAVTRYTVRSTAISGAGLILSVGAGLFLVVWWARHWHRTRRSAKLVAAESHPASRGG